MKIEIVNKRDLSVAEKLKDVLYKKVNKLDKYFDKETPIKISLKEEGGKCKLEIQMRLSDTFLGAEAVAPNFYDAIDLVLPKIEKQIVKYRKKFDKKVKQTAFDNAYLYAESYADNPQSIVKVKKFELLPLSVEEAIVQLEISGHDFYLFLHKDDQKVKVIYKRFGNDYGLIEPIVE